MRDKPICAKCVECNVLICHNTLSTEKFQATGLSTFCDSACFHKTLGVRQHLVVGGTTILEDSLSVKRATVLYDTLDVKRATTLENTLVVQGNTVLQNTLNVTGITTLQSNLDAQQNIDVGGTLDVTGKTTLRDDLDAQQNVDVGGALDVTGITTLRGDLDAQQDVDVGGALDVTGITTLQSKLDAQQNVDVGGTLDVTGKTTLRDDLNMSSKQIQNLLDPDVTDPIQKYNAISLDFLISKYPLYHWFVLDVSSYQDNTITPSLSKQSNNIVTLATISDASVTGIPYLTLAPKAPTDSGSVVYALSQKITVNIDSSKVFSGSDYIVQFQLITNPGGAEPANIQSTWVQPPVLSNYTRTSIEVQITKVGSNMAGSATLPSAYIATLNPLNPGTIQLQALLIRK